MLCNSSPHLKINYYIQKMGLGPIGNSLMYMFVILQVICNTFGDIKSWKCLKSCKMDVYSFLLAKVFLYPNASFSTIYPADLWNRNSNQNKTENKTNLYHTSKRNIIATPSPSWNFSLAYILMGNKIKYH